MSCSFSYKLGDGVKLIVYYKQMQCDCNLQNPHKPSQGAPLTEKGGIHDVTELGERFVMCDKNKRMAAGILFLNKKVNQSHKKSDNRSDDILREKREYFPFSDYIE